MTSYKTEPVLNFDLRASIRDSIGVLHNDLEIAWSAPQSRRKGKITRQAAISVYEVIQHDSS